MFGNFTNRPGGFPVARVLLGTLVIVCALGTGGTRAHEKGSADPQIVTVEGAGIDVESAKKDACRAAVRQVVGAVVSAKTLTVNDDLIDDKVIALSSGFVDKMEPLKEWQTDGLVRVKVLATVRKTKIQETLKANGVSVINVDGQSLGAKLLTSDDQRKGEADFVEEAFEGFPAKLFKATVKDEPRLGKWTPGEPRPRHWDKVALRTAGLHPVVITPASVPRLAGSYFVSSFTCERTFMLNEDEISTLSSASAELK